MTSTEPTKNPDNSASNVATRSFTVRRPDSHTCTVAAAAAGQEASETVVVELAKKDPADRVELVFTSTMEMWGFDPNSPGFISGDDATVSRPTIRGQFQAPSSGNANAPFVWKPRPGSDKPVCEITITIKRQ